MTDRCPGCGCEYSADSGCHWECKSPTCSTCGAYRKPVRPFLNTCLKNDGPPDFHFLDDPLIVEPPKPAADWPEVCHCGKAYCSICTQPARIAELREKYTRCTMPTNPIEIHNDFNELLDMLEKAERTAKDKLSNAEGVVSVLCVEGDRLKAALEAKDIKLYEARGQIVSMTVIQTGQATQIRDLKAELVAKPDIQQDWIRCALVRKAELLKIPMSCHKANELACAVYDEIERQQSG